MSKIANRILYEDGYDSPIWLGFNFTFRAKNLYFLNKIIIQFEAQHPFLTLVSVDSLNEEISVVGDPLFVDGK